jgi:hypothetical protein
VHTQRTSTVFPGSEELCFSNSSFPFISTPQAN